MLYDIIITNLIASAINKETITYSQLAQRINIQNSKMLIPTCGSQLGKTLGPVLDEINDFCKSHNQPALSVLVVRASGADEGMPGRGFWQWVEANQHFFIAEDRTSRKQQAEHFQEIAFDYWAQKETK